MVSHGDFCGEDVVVVTFVNNVSLLPVQQCGLPNAFTSYSLYEDDTYIYIYDELCLLAQSVCIVCIVSQCCLAV